MTHPLGSLGGLVSLLLCLPALGGQPPFSETGDLYVAEPMYDRIAVLDGEGKFLRTFTTRGLDEPSGIVFAPNDRMYVAATQSNEVVVFDRVERFVTRFTSAQLLRPRGLALTASGELMVVSSGLDRVCVFGLDGTFLRWFDAPGLTGPAHIALDSAGSVFVTASTGKVFHWDSAEQFIGSFGAPSGYVISGPSGITCDANDVIHVTGGSSHNVLSFSSDGTFLSELTHPDLMVPQGLAVDDQGHLFVASMFADAVVEFDASGAWYETHDDPQLHFPRDLAFAPPCPPSVAYCTAGTSFSGCQATITTSGSASATKSTGFFLSSTLVEGDRDGWFFYGSSGRQASTWGNGTSFVCIAPPVKRGGSMIRRGTAFTCEGWFNMDLNARWCPTCPKPAHNPGPGAIVQAQLWYRDPLNTSNQTTSFSAAVEFLVCP